MGDELSSISGTERIYYGWFVLAASAAMEIIGTGAVSYGAGLFVLPLQADLGISRAAANSSLLILFLGAALASPFLGQALDRYPIKWITFAGGLFFCIGFVTIASTSYIPLMVFALFVPAAFGFMATGMLVTTTLVSRWFYRRRNIALGIGTVATSGGGFVVVPLLSAAIEAYGWRTALALEGVIIAIIMMALSFLVVRGAPAEVGQEGHSENLGRPRNDFARKKSHDGDNVVRWRSIQILASRNFWGIGPSNFVTSALCQAIVISLVPYAVGLGYTAPQAVVLISVFAIAAAIVKVSSGILADYVSRKAILGVACSAMVVSLLFLNFTPDFMRLAIASALAGAALGGVLPTGAALVAACYGAPSSGGVMGWIWASGLAASILAVLYVGYSFDQFGSYVNGFWALTVVAFFVALTPLLIRVPDSPKAPEAVSNRLAT